MACVGRLDVGAKGQDQILAVLARPQWRDRSWRLCFYGEGPDENYLKQLVSLYKLESRVYFSGYVPDVDDIWAQEHLCLQPSPKEGTPMTVVEAMYAGRPCLVSDRARMPDLIQAGVSGWIVPRNIDALSQALDLVWKNRERLSEMGGKARDFIVAHWEPSYPSKLATLLLKHALGASFVDSKAGS
ncbi:MAG: hypothetical protein A2X46_05010 [Lentisphaerae bacterium GWF2_57_35]|nr:MAG: hypothetical protein A2X46_05010 [Lentisphaerae bacterium GWF2_57_35]